MIEEVKRNERQSKKEIKAGGVQRGGTDREMRMRRGSREGRVSQNEDKERREEEPEKEESVRIVGRRVEYYLG